MIPPGSKRGNVHLSSVPSNQTSGFFLSIFKKPFSSVIDALSLAAVEQSALKDFWSWDIRNFGLFSHHFQQQKFLRCARKIFWQREMSITGAGDQRDCKTLIHWDTQIWLDMALSNLIQIGSLISLSQFWMGSSSEILTFLWRHDQLLHWNSHSSAASLEDYNKLLRSLVENGMLHLGAF